MMNFKPGDLVRAKHYTRSYDTKIRLSEMRKGDLCIILNTEGAMVDVFSSGQVWSLPKDYFELVK